MPRIVRYHLADIIPTLNSATRLDANDVATRAKDDLFLCALGFEQRCLTLPSKLDLAEYRSKRACYFNYATNLEDNAVNLFELERHLSTIAPIVAPIDADTLDFPARLRELLELVVSESRPERPRVTFDISVTANRLLLRCIKVLFEFEICLRVIYSEAAVYYPSQEDFERETQTEEDNQIGLEYGVGDVRPSIDHPGEALDPLPDSLILFPSFKGDRSKAVISFVDPSLLQKPNEKVVWLVGVPHLDDDKWRLEAMKKINEIDEETRYLEVSTFDYKQTLKVLEKLHAELSDKSRITISPLGSKMQALGTALFCYMHSDVRVILSSPREYNAAQYSEGYKEVWKIDFGPLAELRSNLDQVGLLRIVD